MIPHKALKATLKSCHGFAALSVKSVNGSEHNGESVPCMGSVTWLFARAWAASPLPYALQIYAASWKQRRLFRGNTSKLV